MANKLHYAITYFFIGIAVLACLFFSGCNPAKKLARQERKALKHIQKAEVIAPNELAKWCAKRYNPIDSIHEVYNTDTTYLPGEIHFVEIDCDSVVNETKKSGSLLKSAKVTLPCPPCDSTRIINTYKSRFQSETNKAALDSMATFWGRKVAAKDAEISAHDKKIATITEQKKLYRNAAFILGILWVLFFVWKFVKSKFKIFG